MKLGELIREFREAQCLSQRQFAERCNLSNGYISILEKGFNPNTGKPLLPTIPQLKKLATGMNMTVMDMLEQVDDMPIDITTDVSSENILITGHAGSGKSNVIHNLYSQLHDESSRSEESKKLFISHASRNVSVDPDLIRHLMESVKTDVDNNWVYMVGHDGSYRERQLDDMQFSALNAILDQMPDTTK